MTKRTTTPSPVLDAPATGVRKRAASLARHLPVATFIGRTIARLRRYWPGAFHASRDGLRRTTSAVRAMPNSTIGALAAGSAGLGAGLFLGGAPRLVAAAGLAPAVALGAAVLSRPASRVEQSDDMSRLDDDGGPVVVLPVI
jgi:hypothetical protein